MAQFGGGKNPPWVRPAGDVGLPAQPLPLGQPTIQAPPPTVYSLATTQPTLAQQQYAAAAPQLQLPGQGPQAILPQPGIALPTSLASNQLTVSYPAPGVGVTRGPPPTTSAAPPAGGPQAKQRVFTSTVSKLHDNFGFVDEDVFFQTSCVKGAQPKVGDRVLVEATYNANMPFRWNATRIQLLPNQANDPSFSRNNMGNQQNVPHGATSLNNSQITAPSVVSGSQLGGINAPQNSNNFNFHHSNQNQQPPHQPPPPLMANTQLSAVQSLNQSSRINVPSRRNESNYQRDRERDRSERNDRNERNRERDIRHERERRRSPRKRSRSPRRSRSPPLRSHSPPRRRARVIPRYTVQFPKISLDSKDANVITLKARYNNLYIPSDFFNTQFCWADVFPINRPFTLGNPCSFHVMNKETTAVEKNEAVLEPSDASHLYSAKVVLMATPTLEDLYHRSCGLAEDSADIRDSFQHPTRVIQFLVGLKGKNEPMAIGGPWSPSLDGQNPDKDPTVLIRTAIRTTQALTGINLSACTQWYRFAEMRYQRPAEYHHGRLVPARMETVVIFLPDVWTCSPSALEWESITNAYKSQLRQQLGKDSAVDNKQEDVEDKTNDTKDPTHYSLLDPKIMKVSELRTELEARQLSNKGLKSQMIARLTKSLKSEQEKAEEEAEKKHLESTKEDHLTKAELEDKEDKRKREEEEKQRRDDKLEKYYTLPENPCIVVHPSTTAKSGKFDCTIMSLSVLLDYRQEDNKEHSFEVSLFAELFNEMLMRDFAYEIYKVLYAMPDKSKKNESTVKDAPKDSSSKEKDNKSDKEEEKRDEEEMEIDHPHEEEDKSNDKHRSSSNKKRPEKSSKLVTVNKPLLLACVYFDQTHTGYIVDKDLEDMLHIMGLHLSRSQIKKLIGPSLTRDVFNYRKLTDRPSHEVKDRSDEDVDKKDDADQSMLLGNRPLVDMLRRGETQESPSLKLKIKEEPNEKSAEGGGESITDTKSNMVLHEGALIDVASLMARLEKAEKTRTAMEDRYKKLKIELDEVKTNYTSSEQLGQKLNTELQEQKKRLRDQRKTLINVEFASKSYKDTLSKVNNTLKDLSDTVTHTVKTASQSMDADNCQLNGN